MRTPLFTWLVFALIVSDLQAMRAYFNMGRNLIEVGLLDVAALSPFARRGLRSALGWMIFSIIFSLFWLGDAASEANLSLFIIVLTMATTAFVVLLLGVRNNILSVKHVELDHLREAIRVERASVIDAANLLRFFMYLLIGLGSWLGGAVVERMLDRTLAG